MANVFVPKVNTEERIVRKYYVSFGQLKAALGLKGEVVESNLWSGLSFAAEDRGESRDKEIVEIVTEEIVKQRR